MVIILDVGYAMCNNGTEPLEIALKSATMLIQQKVLIPFIILFFSRSILRCPRSSTTIASDLMVPKILHGPNDEVAVILFGTQGTKNDLASTGGYQNITVLFPLDNPTVEMLMQIEEVTPGRAQADCMYSEIFSQSPM